MSRPPRTPITLGLDEVLVAEARAAGVDLRRAVEAGLREAIRGAAAWREENAEALAASNAYVEEHGLPLAKYRMF